jgi:DNA-binding transcriptional LysR family regulator
MLELHDQGVAPIAVRLSGLPARIGMVQDFAEDILSDVLSLFSALHPASKLRIRIGNSSELMGLFAGGLIDVVACLTRGDDPAAVRTIQMAWLGAPALFERRPLPVVLMEGPCVFRDAAVRALVAQDLEYDVVLETPSLSVLRAAVKAGLGVTCRASGFVYTDVADDPLPSTPLPHFGILVDRAAILPAPIERLAALIHNAIASTICPP